MGIIDAARVLKALIIIIIIIDTRLRSLPDGLSALIDGLTQLYISEWRAIKPLEERSVTQVFKLFLTHSQLSF